MGKLESKFQADLIKHLRTRYRGAIILKNDSSYQQGVPDWLILYKDKWATLECKRSVNAPFEPNQEYFIEQMDRMSFSAAIYPANQDAVLADLDDHFFGSTH